MAETAKRDTAETQYLLGSLSESERARIEEVFFADDAKFAQLEVAEDELIDAYVRDELSPGENQQFRAKLLTSPRLVERVNFARALADKVDSFRPPESERSIDPTWWARFFAQRLAWQMAMAVCTVVVLIASIVLVSGWLRLRNESERLAAERAAYQHQKEELEKLSTEQRTRAEQLNAELQRAQNQRAEDLKAIQELQQALKLKESGTQQSFLGTIATVILTPGSLRSGGADQPELIVGPETKLARLQLALEKNDYPTYNATIKTADEAVIFRRTGLRPHNTGSGPQLLLSLPSRRLSRGDYIVQIDGVTGSGRIESVSDYAFLVKTAR